MKTKFVLKNIIVTFSIFLLIGCEQQDIIDEETKAILGTSSPNIVTEAIDGTTINLESLKGKPVVINFWASWCRPCKEEAPELENTYQFFKNRDVQFIGIASGDKLSDAKKFIEEFKTTYPIALDEDRAIANKYSVLTLPITFILDREGKVSFKKVGIITEDKLKQEIRKVL